MCGGRGRGVFILKGTVKQPRPATWYICVCVVPQQVESLLFRRTQAFTCNLLSQSFHFFPHSRNSSTLPLLQKIVKGQCIRRNQRKIRSINTYHLTTYKYNSYLCVHIVWLFWFLKAWSWNFLFGACGHLSEIILMCKYGLQHTWSYRKVTSYCFTWLEPFKAMLRPEFRQNY